MGTSYQEIYSAFQSMILEDEWAAWEEEDIETDFRLLLEQAIPYFKFPRTSLERNDEGFTNILNTIEIQILASYMKIAWLNRCILTWQHLKPLYSEADFSQANLIDKFTKQKSPKLRFCSYGAFLLVSRKEIRFLREESA